MISIKQTPQDNEILTRVLDLDIPTYRDAYSDRTAWLMTCVAEQAYIKFNKPKLNDERIKATFRKFVNEAMQNPETEKTIDAVVDKFVHDHKHETKMLEKDLGFLQYSLVNVFDKDGSQALLACNEDKKRLILAFRGTELTDVRDIKADIDAKLQSHCGGGKSHRGFSTAYWAIGGDIQARLDQNDITNYRLYITGHSLGGALATIAAKYIVHRGGISACYTFGSPRVGNKDWVADIKPPIYRVVNSSDIVPMLPPDGDILRAIGWIIRFIPLLGKPCAKFLEKYTGYFHSGDMRFLTQSEDENFTDTKLLPHTGLSSRISLWIQSRVFKKGVQDHSISIYRKKLGAIALNRNSKST